MRWRHTTLSEESYGLEDFDEDASAKEDHDNIYWYDIDETFVHEASGVGYDRKYYLFFLLLSSSPDDRIVNGTLQLANRGWRRKANTESLRD